MDETTHQLALRRRRDTAVRAAGELPAVAERPVPAAEPRRAGVAKIDSNDGGGGYTITEQWWQPGGSPQWTSATKPLGHVQAAARDCRNCDAAEAGELVRFWEQRAVGGALELLIDATGTPQGIARAAGTDEVLDKWIDVTQGTSGTYIDDPGADWRGRAVWYSVRICEETPANADDDEFDDDGADYQEVRCVVVGCDWDADSDEPADVTLWSDNVLQTDLVLERNTGRLYVRCSWGGTRHQLRVTVRASAAKASTDPGVPEITI